MSKYCKFCGKEFEPLSNRQEYCKGPHIRTCPVCGCNYEETNVENLKRPPKACSYKCRAAKTQKTSLSRYGCKAPGNNPEAREEARLTCLKNNGVEYAMQSDEIKEKSKNTLIDRYGVDNAGKSAEVISKRMKTNRERYGDVMPFNRPECYEKQHSIMMKKYGVPYGSMTPNAIKQNGHISKLNLRIKSKIESLGFTVELEKYLDGKMYDLFIPDRNILIEVDPTYTHNSIGNHWAPSGLDKYYHKNKTKLAVKNGFSCIHVFDWDNQDILLPAIFPTKEIDGSSLRVYRLTTKATNEFLSKNHYRGSHRGQLLCLGLVKDDTIYQVMTFGKPTYSKDHSIQLYRMCSKIGYEVIDGYDILSKFASELGLCNIITYSDLAKFDGTEFEKIGMKFVRQSPPRKIWSKGLDYINSTLIVSGRSPYCSEELMLKDGWLPVYDCGQAVYEF